MEIRCATKYMASAMVLVWVANCQFPGESLSSSSSMSAMRRPGVYSVCRRSESVEPNGIVPSCGIRACMMSRVRPVIVKELWLSRNCMCWSMMWANFVVLVCAADKGTMVPMEGGGCRFRLGDFPRFPSDRCRTRSPARSSGFSVRWEG